MSIQSVNLYLPELRPSKEWLTANTVAISLLGFVLIILGASALMSHNLKDYQHQVAVLEDQQAQIESRLEEFRARPTNNGTLQLDRKLTKLRSAILAREQIGQIIQGQNLGNEEGFSGVMNAFARQYIDSISLEHIRVSRGGAYIELKGATRLPRDIPRYLQNLQSEKSISDAQFGLLSVMKNPKNSREHVFAFGFDSLFSLAAKEGG